MKTSERRLLAADVGNTETTFGVFIDGKLIKRFSLSSDKKRSVDEWAMLIDSILKMNNIVSETIKDSIVSSVVPSIDFKIKKALNALFGKEPLFVIPGVKTGINILYENPHEVGADRVVNAVAVSKLYELPAVVIDFGTAITFDVVDKNNSYLGGIIFPGINIASESLFSKTAKLPNVFIQKPKKVIGKTTITSIQAGLYYGYISLIEGLIKRIKNEIKGLKSVVATGGLAELFVSDLKTITHIDENLTLKGLYYIYLKNLEDG